MKDYIYKQINQKQGKIDLMASLYPGQGHKRKAVLLYFHGGGLLMGQRNDLPNYHLEMLTKAGYSILSFDYRLAPESSFHLILEDVLDAINYFINSKTSLGLEGLPYFLWGRSAGAYLALLSYKMGLGEKPRGIISYYGYGFLYPDWYKTPSYYYLQYPKVSRKSAEGFIRDMELAGASPQIRFPLYLYYRQTGTWFSSFAGDNEENFLANYSLLNLPAGISYPPTFLAHGLKDEDVPFRESVELSKLIKDSFLYTPSVEGHDFDRQEDSRETVLLLSKTLEFLDRNL